MTRAKEKLILTGSLKMGEDGLEPYVNHMTDRESSLSLYQLEGANRYLDWILPALLQAEDLKREDGLCGILKTESEEVQQLPIKVRIFDFRQRQNPEIHSDHLGLPAGKVQSLIGGGAYRYR